MAPYIGASVSRIDGIAKVTGAAKYAAEFNIPGLLYGSIVASTIAKGRITRMDTTAAKRVKGVVDVMTYDHRSSMADTDQAYKDEVAPLGSPFRPLYDNKVMFNGQPIALVVGETSEAARLAASLVKVEYEKEAFVTVLQRQRQAAKDVPPPTNPFEELFVPPKTRGQPQQALAAAAVRHEGEYSTPIEHHNPMELYASTVVYEPDGKLTVYHKTQGVQNTQRYLCGVFGLKPDELRVVSPYVGGAFGVGLRPQFDAVLAVLAARALKRSVRVVLTRPQMYALGYRPAMIQRVALGAGSGGSLDAITHDATTVTSQYENYFRQETGWSGLLYASANASYAHRTAKLDLPTPCDMRCPSAATGVYALECAMDELSGRAQGRSAGAAPALLQRSQSEHWSAVQQQGLARMLQPGRQGLRLGQAQSASSLDARRRRSGRLGHGNRRLGRVPGADHRAHRARRRRPCRGCLRDLRHRHRHLHHHGAGRRRHARAAVEEHQRQARRLDAAAIAGRRRIVDRSLGVKRHRNDGRGRPRRIVAPGEADNRFAR